MDVKSEDWVYKLYWKTTTFSINVDQTGCLHIEECKWIHISLHRTQFQLDQGSQDKTLSTEYDRTENGKVLAQGTACLTEHQ